MTDVKALRALLEAKRAAVAAFFAHKPYDEEGERLYSLSVEADTALEVASLNALPELLALAEAVRDLAGPIAMLVEHGDIAERDAARRVTAILEGK